jgi:hypothetical protein
MDAVSAITYRVWTEGPPYVTNHWKAIASLVITVATLYFVWGKIALAGVAAAAAASIYYKLPVISYVELFDVKGVALSAATLTIPTLIFPWNYLAASSIAVLYLAHEKEAMQARLQLQGVIDKNQTQIQQLEKLTSECSQMCTTFEAAIEKHTTTNTALAAVQTTAGEVRVQVEEQTAQLVARIGALRTRISADVKLQDQLALQSQIANQISAQTAQLESLKARITQVEQQILPQLQSLVANLTTNEEASTTYVETLRALLTQFQEGGVHDT